MTSSRQTVRLDFCSTFEMVDFVQTVSDHIGRLVGLDDDALHWVGVAVRESVINAIKHGNAGDERKRVYVEFTPLERESPPGMAIRVRDEGPGFDPAARARPARIPTTCSRPAAAASSSSAASWTNCACSRPPRAAWKW